METLKFWAKTYSLILIASLFGHQAVYAQANNQPDSIVQITAEAEGLSQIAPEDLPLIGGTYWEVMPNGVMAPLPCPPFDLTLPIYGITDNIFLVDGTGGQVSVPHQQTMTSEAVAAAVEAQGNAIADLIEQVQETELERGMMMSLGIEPPSPGGGGDYGDYTNYFSSTFFIDTNLLWLEITNVSGGTVYSLLHNATNQVYAIWGTTNLLSSWSVETELWPTDTNVMPFTVATRSREDLFLRAEDWTDKDSNTDGVPDWWAWKHFGDFNVASTNDYDGDGVDNGTEYANNTDPNNISFTLRLGNQNFNTTNATGNYLILNGVPAFAAVLVNNESFTNAFWQAYTTNLSFVIGPTDGVYQVQFGLKGRTGDSVATWIGTEVTLNRTAPQITITSPTNGIVAQPYIQLKGFATLPLESVTYDLNGQTNVLGFITDSVLDTNTLNYTTNYFQCYDLKLNEGTNAISLHTVDPAGNSFTTNLTVILDYDTATNPVIALTWPQNDMKLCGTNFTLRGWTEDATAKVCAVVNETNVVQGMVERTGKLWVEDLPLNAGTNYITLLVTNAAGLGSETNFYVTKSDLVLTLDTVTGSLWQPWVHVSGTISDTNAPIWVNGVQGTNNGNGTWSAKRVPVSDGGVASFDVSTIPPGEPDPAINVNLNKPDETRLESGDWTEENHANVDDTLGGALEYNHDHWNWELAKGGTQRNYFKADHATNSDYYTSTVVYQTEPDRTIPVENVDVFFSWFNTGNTNYNLYDVTLSDPEKEIGWLWETPQDEGALNYRGSPNPDYWWKESGQAKLMFYTGGKIGVGTESFYEASGTVTEKLVNAKGEITESNVPSLDITVAGFGQNLDAFGEAWTVLPNPPKVDVTTKAKVPRRKITTQGGKNSPVSYTIYPALTDTNRNRTKIGVGEEVSLYFKPSLPKSAVWDATDGGFYLRTNSSVLFTAPSNANPNVVVKAVINNKTLSFPSFNVAKPSTLTAVKYGPDDTFPTNAYGAGMHLLITVHPTDVCFYKVQSTEIAGPASNITGVFTNWPATNFYHWPSGVVGITNKWTQLGFNNEATDHSAFSIQITPVYPGGYDIVIPNHWRVGPDGPEYPYQTITATARILDNTGTAVKTKFGQTAQRP